MTDRSYRLAESTLAEPLVNGWPAWWMTLAPVPASLNVHQHQVPLLKAYLQTPEFHAKAARDPALSGTAFMGVPPARAGEVKALLQRTLADQADRIQVAEALEELQGWLWAEAKGQALEPLYGKVPAPLHGLVELVYDYANRPTARFVEPFTYRTRCWRPDLHSVRLSTLESDASRPSLYATPRLPEPGRVDLALPFSDERLDRLFALDLEPRPLSHVRDLLGPAAESDGELLPLLTDAPLPPPAAAHDGPLPRVRYLGHACVLVEWKGVSLLTDAVVAPRPASGGMARISFQDLPRRIDYVLVTHAHADHLAFDALLRLRHRIGAVLTWRSGGMLAGDFSPGHLLRAVGFKDVRELDALDSVPIPDGEVVAAPFLGEHGDLAHGKASWVVRAGAERMLFAADSTCVDAAVYRHLRQAVGQIHSVFMNTEIEGAPLSWTLEVLFPRKRDRKLEKNRRCRGSNAAEALRLLEAVGAKRLYNYAMGLEPWVEHIIGPPAPPDAPRMKESDQLLAAARERGLEARRLCGPAELSA
jgi:L-ascorbate metabolism protein UlaG (beta-lactamase superfamily)